MCNICNTTLINSGYGVVDIYDCRYSVVCDINSKPQSFGTYRSNTIVEIHEFQPIVVVIEAPGILLSQVGFKKKKKTFTDGKLRRHE